MPTLPSKETPFKRMVARMAASYKKKPAPEGAGFHESLQSLA
jgi:hypothetical protein